jgi:site-specific DNA-methyltransferase (adenine-specific)
MELMARYPDKHFNLAIVDPPYGINRSKNFGLKKFGWKQYKIKDWDNEIPSPEYFKELFRVSQNQVIWGGNYMVQYLQPSMGWIFWDKGQREFSTSDGELAYTSFQKKLKVIDFSRAEAMIDNGVNKIHPTQKPIYLYKFILQHYALPGDLILDTHGGSFSSAIACLEYDFELIACEIDKDYFEAGIKRIKNHLAQTKLF